MWCSVRKYGLLNKQNCIYSNNLIIISVLAMHCEVSKDDATLWCLLDLWTFEAFQGSYSSPLLTMHWFLVSWKYSEPSWKSGPAKTRPARLVLPPLNILHLYCNPIHIRRVMWCLQSYDRMLVSTMISMVRVNKFTVYTE